MECFHNAEKQKRAKPTTMFDDVYDELPLNLKKQRQEMINHLKLYKNEYPLDMFEKLWFIYFKKMIGCWVDSSKEKYFKSLFYFQESLVGFLNKINFSIFGFCINENW